MCTLKSMLVVTLIGCGSTVTKYAVDAKVGAEGVEATHSWGSVGDRFKVPGISNLDPPLADLDTMVELAKWTSYSDERSCFGIVSYQRTQLSFPDGQGNQSEDPVDWRAAKYELTTSSGQTLKPEPANVNVGSPVEVNYQSKDTATGAWVPATERFVHAEIEVCFQTPKPLKQEKWVRWSYMPGNKARIEITFNVQPGG